ERSKDVLDDLYDRSGDAAGRIQAALNVYGIKKFSDEFYYCIEQIEQFCNDESSEKLRNIIFEDRNTNAFPAVFTLIFIAFHEMFVKEKKSISSYSGVKSVLTNLTRRIDTSRRATASDERRKNIDTIKGIISPHFVSADPSKSIYSDHKTIDLDDYIKRSGMELANYELKQGLLSLDGKRELNVDLMDRIVETICAIANNGPDRAGRVLLGVADKPADVTRIISLDKIQPRTVGDRAVVGIVREAVAMGITLEDYHNKIRTHIANSKLSEPLKSAVLSSIDYNAYYGLGVIVISVPEQKEPSYFKDQIYWRNGDNTELAKTPKQIADISRRF
ncbi:hypothetical protein AEAC466_15040, partial [Asticcacaulis sp. AC466]|uniref:AlbA family DNA-binding domain-containing protein n=1 Tax=Asticcacaulis sp. AC466 TaxID=1282362 RepID=UPI0003C4007B